MFTHGDKVRITRGKYKTYQSGTFLRYSGTKKADVQVDGDTRQERNLLLTSIEKWDGAKPSFKRGFRRFARKEPKNGDTPAGKDEDVEALAKELAELKLRMKTVEETLKIER